MTEAPAVPAVPAVPAEKAEKPKSNRRKFRIDTWTDEQVAARMAELTKPEAPEGWVKLARLDDACRESGIPISRMVRATGGDRGMFPPADPLFQIVYVGRTRYVHPDTLTKGLEMLKQEGFAATARKPRAKKEKAAKEAKDAATAPSEKPAAQIRRVSVK